ncbi:hypothetical protein JHW45_08500 [Paracoccus stylophorae]|uniref:Uncharacterized protein n=1 Tax=Paracoccus stylophorae TaxID=659350 RepID=A0ABY7SZ47_9RHOB|nr:hypothetical protein [Paracoccus stylophorae]WCR12332.1 hypothetical protein JHW45_08500 [Paracoccus stylophorae]
MTLLPALLVAVLAGLLGALLTLLSGHGWVAALIVYWLSGNLGMVAMLVPLVLCRRRSGCDKPAANLPRLSARPMVWAMCWIMLGLGLIFWQVFASADPPSAPAKSARWWDWRTRRGRPARITRSPPDCPSRYAFWPIWSWACRCG